MGTESRSVFYYAIAEEMKFSESDEEDWFEDWSSEDESDGESGEDLKQVPRASQITQVNTAIRELFYTNYCNVPGPAKLGNCSGILKNNVRSL